MSGQCPAKRRRAAQGPPKMPPRRPSDVSSRSEDGPRRLQDSSRPSQERLLAHFGSKMEKNWFPKSFKNAFHLELQFLMQFWCMFAPNFTEKSITNTSHVNPLKALRYYKNRIFWALRHVGVFKGKIRNAFNIL